MSRSELATIKANVQIKRKAAIYARVSSKEQEKEGFSIPAQLKLLTAYAAEKGFSVVQQYVDDLVLVDDDAIGAAMILILERCKLLAEPAGAAALAALLSGAAQTQPGAPVVAILSGGNVDAGRLAKLLAE